MEAVVPVRTIEDLRSNGRLSQEDHTDIFDHLVKEGQTTVSMSQLHTGMEAVVPVRTIEDLRRRFIATGFRSMTQALLQMEEEANWRSGLLSSTQFGALLSQVGILEEEEHWAIFSAVCDRHHGSVAMVSIEMLFAALAAVSPSLLLEDLQERLQKQYGSLEVACDALGFEDGSMIRPKE